MLGTRKGRTHWHLLYATVHREAGFPFRYHAVGEEHVPTPHPFQTVILSLALLENPTVSACLPALVTGLVGIIRLC